MSQQQLDQRPTNTVVARRWIAGAVALFLVGAIGTAVLPNFVLDLLTSASSGTNPWAIRTVEVLASLIQWGSFATGGALIAAALVIQRLPTTTDDREDSVPGD